MSDSTFADRLQNPKVYWDLAKFFEGNSGSYQDWEGMCDPAEAIEVVDRIITKWDFFMEDGDRKEWVKDMLLHYVFTIIDQVGEEALPNDDVLCGIFEGFQFLAQVPRYMMRSDAE